MLQHLVQSKPLNTYWNLNRRDGRGPGTAQSCLVWWWCWSHGQGFQFPGPRASACTSISVLFMNSKACNFKAFGPQGLSCLRFGFDQAPGFCCMYLPTLGETCSNKCAATKPMHWWQHQEQDWPSRGDKALSGRCSSNENSKFSSFSYKSLPCGFHVLCSGGVALGR